MRTPTEYELDALVHYAIGYDPVAAKLYYEKHKQLKGRRRGSAQPPPSSRRSGSSVDPRKGKTREEIAIGAKATQKKELAASIGRMMKMLQELETLIRKREHEEKSEDRKSKAKKERASKEKDKPKTAAEKASDARDSEKYRDKHKQELKSKSDDKKSGGSDSKKKKESGKKSASELRTRATKLRGKIAVAKQKLAAL